MCNAQATTATSTLVEHDDGVVVRILCFGSVFFVFPIHHITARVAVVLRGNDFYLFIIGSACVCLCAATMWGPDEQ